MADFQKIILQFKLTHLKINANYHKKELKDHFLKCLKNLTYMYVCNFP